MKRISEEEQGAIVLNPDDYYSQELDNWADLWDSDKSLFENTKNIIQQIVFLPKKELLSTLVATYILIPSKWAKVVPIMFCHGEPGSGKSTISMLANYFHGYEYTFSPTDTFASLRNALDSMRWLSPDDKNIEKEGAMLCWDNIHSMTLERDLKIYQMLLCGYNRQTDRIQIAGKDGVNIPYYVFCPKIISSVEPLHINPNLQELQRRLLIIPHKKIDKFDGEELAEYGDLDFETHKLEIDSIFWKGIEENYLTFWNNPENCKLYAKYRGLLSKKSSKRIKLPESFTQARWTISIDLITTGIVIGAWNDINQAITCLGEYWSYIDAKILNQVSATLEHLKEFIEEEVGMLLALNEKLKQNRQQPQEIILNATKLKSKLSQLQNEGKLDITPKQRDVNMLMDLLGWTLKKKGWIQK
jgi:hypothetical protein